MKRLLRPNAFLALGAALLAGLLGWCFLAGAAQAPTNAPPPTNTPVLDLALPDREAIRENAAALTFGLNALPALQHTVLGRPLWQFIAFALYLLLAFYAAKFADWLIHSRFRAWADRTSNQWDDVLVGLLDGPVKMIVFVLLVNVGLQLFDWPDWAETWVQKLTILAVGLSLMLVVLKAVDAAVKIWQQKLPADGDRQFNEQFVLLVGKALKGVLVVVAVFTVLGNLGFDIRAALASVSVAGLALGLAAQDTVANLFGAVAVFVDKPFKLGDRVKIGDVDGTIEEMGLRSTRVRALDGAFITVPNKSMGNATIINITRRPAIRATFGLGLVYETPAVRVREAAALLEEILRTHPATHDFVVHFNRFGDFALNLDVVWWCRTTDWKEYTRHFQELNLAIKERFDVAGFDFAFPTQTVHVPRGDHDPRLAQPKD
ncbi:MAG: mechanosensitive ion channel family protein [Limisphaerales bacterium]